MSNMIPDNPPQTITIGGSSPQATGLGRPMQQAGGDGPDSVRVIGLVRRAKALLAQALLLERDHADALVIERCTTELTKFLASSQDLTDNPNRNPVKAIRKFTRQGY
jgi:hypothetical protein